MRFFCLFVFCLLVIYHIFRGTVIEFDWLKGAWQSEKLILLLFLGLGMATWKHPLVCSMYLL